MKKLLIGLLVLGSFSTLANTALICNDSNSLHENRSVDLLSYNVEIDETVNCIEYLFFGGLPQSLCFTGNRSDLIKELNDAKGNLNYDGMKTSGAYFIGRSKIGYKVLIDGEDAGSYRISRCK